MKKTIAALALSALVILPATSAWAASEGASSSKEVDAAIRSSEPSTSRDPSVLKQLYAWGCHAGVEYELYTDSHGNVFGYHTGVRCYGDTTIFYC